MIKAMKNKNMQPNKIWASAVQLMLLSFVLLLSQLTLAKDRIQYHVQNFDGSTLKVINEKGVVSQSYQYAPFGQQLQYKKPSNLKNPNAFVGGVQDADDLVYLKQRHYNPVLGRFYQPDPVTFIMKGHGQTNRYQYGWNDTYTFSDPTGQAAVVKNGVWVEDGMSFYSTSGGSVTDYLGQNFLNDFATLAPTPKFKWLTGISDLIFKPQYDNIMDLRGMAFNTYTPLSKPWLNKNIAKLPTPSFPPGIETQNKFGSDFIKWGKGPEGALIRSQNITKFEVAVMQSQGLTLQMASQWRTFYANEFFRNVHNTTAQNRVLLMNRIIEHMENIRK